MRVFGELVYFGGFGRDEAQELRVLDLLSGGLSADVISQVEVGRFPWLRFESDSSRASQLCCSSFEREFKLISAVRFRSVLQAISIVSFLWFVAYGSAIWATETPSTRSFYLLVMMGIPMAYLVVSSRIYTRYPQALTLSMTLVLGFGTVYQKIRTQDFSNMILSLFVIVVFTATPLVLANAAAVALLVIVAFLGSGLWTVRSALEEGRKGLTYEDFAILGMTNLMAYGFLVYMTYWREQSLRKAIISRHMLLLKASQVNREAEKTRDLLKSMLPDLISEQLQSRSDQSAPLRIAEKYSSVTIMFVEVCNFNDISSEQTQDELVDILNTVFSVFDSVLEDYHAYKVETIGQVYMVVGGCPHRARRHGEDVGELALEFVSVMPEVNQLLRVTVPTLRRSVGIRIGLNTGPIVAGVVGQKTPRFKLFGDTVNTASRMQSTCPANQIQVSESSHKALRAKFNLKYRGSISVKGRGEMDTYYLTGRKDTFSLGEGTLVKDKAEMLQQISINRARLFRSLSANGFTDASSPSIRSLAVAPVGSTTPGSESGGRSSGKGSSKVSPLQDATNPSSTSMNSVDDESNKMSLAAISSQSMGPLHGVSGEDPDGEDRRRGRLGRLLDLLHRYSHFGTPDFWVSQKDKGITSVARMAALLLKVLPILLATQLIVYVAVRGGEHAYHEALDASARDVAAQNLSLSGALNATGMLPGEDPDHEHPNEFLFIGAICVTVIMFLLSGLVVLMYKNPRIMHLVSYATGATFLSILALLVWINLGAVHPNSSFLMVVITFFLNLQVWPMRHRALFSLFASLVNCAALIIVLEQPDYDGSFERYVFVDLEPATQDNLLVDSHDIIIHFVLLIVSIVLQLWCVVMEDMFLFQEFLHNKLIVDQNRILRDQKAKTTTLLSQLLPPSIVPKLMADTSGQQARIVDRFDNVTILFTDMVGFTAFSRSISALALLDFLNAMYTRFDAITEKHQLYKVEIIGDAYFVVGGCPIVSADHTEKIGLAALEMLECLPELCDIAHRILCTEQQAKRVAEEKDRKLARNSMHGGNEQFDKLKNLPDEGGPEAPSRGGRPEARDRGRDPAGAEGADAEDGHGEGKSRDDGSGGSGGSAQESESERENTDTKTGIGADKQEGGGSQRQEERDSKDARPSGSYLPNHGSSEDLYKAVPMPNISIRIGVHVGSVVAGVVGFKDPRYHIFGDSVSIANSMEAKSKPGRLHITQSTVDNLKKCAGFTTLFDVEPREIIDLSPVARPQQTYFLNRKKPDSP